MAEGQGRFGAPREVFLDDRGVALRVSWHDREGVAVLSLWRGDRCIGTFRADHDDMSGIIACLSRSLAEAAGADRAVPDSA